MRALASTLCCETMAARSCVQDVTMESCFIRSLRRSAQNGVPATKFCSLCLLNPRSNCKRSRIDTQQATGIHVPSRARRQRLTQPNARARVAIRSFLSTYRLVCLVTVACTSSDAVTPKKPGRLARICCRNGYYFSGCSRKSWACEASSF